MPALLLILFPSLSLADTRGVTIEGKTPPKYVEQTLGKSWAVTIGIDSYQNLPRLSYAVADAQSMGKMLARQGFEVTSLINKQATRRSILRELGRDLLLRVRPEDRVLIFFAGHGETENIGGGQPMGYMMPIDSEPDLLAGTAISMGLIRELSEAIPAKQVLFLIDICYGGIAGRRMRSLSPMTSEYLQVITREPARQLITAGGPGQKALEGPEWNHSVFTYYLLEGLEKGFADLNSDGIIPASELFSYVDEHVLSASLMRNHSQRPELWTLTAANGEFVFIPESSPPQIQVAQVPSDQGKMRDPEAGAIQTFERLLKKLEDRLESVEGKTPPSQQGEAIAKEQADLEAQRKAFELESQQFRKEQKQREEQLSVQLAESRRMADEQRQQREQEAEQVRQEQEAQLAQQQAALQKEQQRLADLEAQRQETLAQKEQELEAQAAEARRLAQAAEVARLAQETQKVKQQAAQQAEEQRRAAKIETKQKRALAQKEQELQKQAAETRRLAQAAEKAEQSRLVEEARVAQEQADLQAEQQRLADLEIQRQQALAQQEQELKAQADEDRRLAQEAKESRLEDEARVAQEQAAKQEETQRLAAEEEAEREQALAQKEQALQEQIVKSPAIAEAPTVTGPLASGAGTASSVEPDAGFLGFFKNIFSESTPDSEGLDDETPSEDQTTDSYEVAAIAGDQPQSSLPEPILEARARPSNLPQAMTSKISGKDNVPMAVIPASQFAMGSTPEEISQILENFEGIPFDAFKAEFPQHQVTLSEYRIDQYEVTVNQYDRFLEATNRTPPKFWNNERFKQPDFPVLGVTWYDAEAYCQWVGKRLPTEAEWENAARGAKGYFYPWGNNWNSTQTNTASYWAGENLSSIGQWAIWMQTAMDEGKAGPKEVGEIQEGISPYGLYDMAGNVSEWVADWFSPYDEQPTLVRDPKGEDSGRMKVHRGGSWSVTSVFARSSYRAREKPELGNAYIGFRCAKSP